MGRVSCFGISKHKAQKQSALSNLSPLWASLPKKWTDLDTYHSRQRFEIMEYIYIYLEPDGRPLFWGGWPSILWVKSSKMWGPNLGSRYIIYTLHCFFVCFFSTRWWVFHVTPSNESKRTLVPSQGRSFQMFLTFGTPSDPWSWESKNSRYEDTDRWASDQFNLLM